MKCTEGALKESVKLCALRDRASRASCLTCSRILRASCLTCLLPYMLWYPTCLVSYVLLCLTCPRVLRVLAYLTSPVPCVFSGCSCVVPYLHLCSSSLTCFRFLKPNMLLCISCLVAFMLFASFDFGALAICAFYTLG